MSKKGNNQNIIAFRSNEGLNKCVRLYCKEHKVRLSSFIRTAITERIKTQDSKLGKLLTEV